MNQVLSQSVSPSVLTVVRGFAKVFVGEIVEKGQSTLPPPSQTHQIPLQHIHCTLVTGLLTRIDAIAKSVAKHDGPLTPSDLREAYRIYLLEHEGAGKAGGGKKKMFVK